MHNIHEAIRNAEAERDARSPAEKFEEHQKNLYIVRPGHNFKTISANHLLQSIEEGWERALGVESGVVETSKDSVRILEIFANITKTADITPNRTPYWDLDSKRQPIPNVPVWGLFSYGTPARGMNEGSSTFVGMTDSGDFLAPGVSYGCVISPESLSGAGLVNSMAKIVVEHGLEWPQDK